MITALERAGASLIALDTNASAPSLPERGGAASDALLIEATRASGRVVFPITVSLLPEQEPAAEREGKPHVIHPRWSTLEPQQARRLPSGKIMSGPLPVLASQAAGLGHSLGHVDEDGLVRKVPLLVNAENRAIPALGLLLAASFLQISPEAISLYSGAILFPAGQGSGRHPQPISIPVDAHGQMLIHQTSRQDGKAFRSISFLEIWDAIEHGEAEQLREWAANKIVVILAEEKPRVYRTPLQPSVSDSLLQVEVLNTILTGQWIREAPAIAEPVLALALSGVAAGSLLVSWGWTSLVSAAGLAVGYVLLVLLGLWLGGLILPWVVPLSALLLTAGGSLLWTHLTASRRVRLLEGQMLKVHEELAAVRAALIYRESVVEGLEEDLHAARAAAAKSAGKEHELGKSLDELRRQLADAQAQEEMTRRAMRALENELAGLRSATGQRGRLGDAEQERLRQECERMGILTRDPQVLGAFRDLKKGARSMLPVLILGEPGTGKELFARAIHRLSPRADQPFVAVNMGAIPPDLFEAELFGHRKGSFTGAVGDRRGYFEQAHRGTIFLDEIGDLRLEHQGKLLRVLQEKSFYRVGDVKPTSSDVRVVAATNKDLQRGVAEGWFREDLYFRLKGLVLRLPPLRERPQDVLILAERFMRDAAAQVGNEDLTLSQEALEALQAHPWPGNIRELQHCLEQAVALADGRVITRADLRLAAMPPGKPSGPRSGQASPVLPLEAHGDLAVLACLRRHEFDMQATARELGWDRSTVTQRLKGLSFKALVEAGGDRARAALALAGDPALARTVELKLSGYYEHLIKSAREFSTAEQAVEACKRRLKNLPDRHFPPVEILIRQYFDQSRGDLPG